MCSDVDPDFGLVPVSLKSLENTKTNPDILHLGCASVWCVSLIQLCCLPLSLCRRAAVVIRQFVLKLPPPELHPLIFPMASRPLMASLACTRRYTHNPAVCTHRCTSLGLGACKLATSHSLAFNTHKSIDDDDLLVLGRCQTKNNHQIHFHCQMYFALFFSSSHQRPCSPIISSRFDLLESCWLYWSWSAQDFSRKSHHPKVKKWRRKNTFTLYAAPWPSPWCLCWCWRTAWQSCTGQEG